MAYPFSVVLGLITELVLSRVARSTYLTWLSLMLYKFFSLKICKSAIKHAEVALYQRKNIWQMAKNTLLSATFF